MCGWLLAPLVALGSCRWLQAAGLVMVVVLGEG